MTRHFRNSKSLACTALLCMAALPAAQAGVTDISNTPLSPAQRAEAHRGFIGDFYAALESGAIRPLIDRVFSFEQAPAAKDYVETNQLIGKVVVTMP